MARAGSTGSVLSGGCRRARSGSWHDVLPPFAGFLVILIDDRRRGLQDRLARTVVVYASDLRRLS
jgi:hypothetical protein